MTVAEFMNVWMAPKYTVKYVFRDYEDDAKHCEFCGDLYDMSDDLREAEILYIHPSVTRVPKVLPPLILHFDLMHYPAVTRKSEKRKAENEMLIKAAQLVKEEKESACKHEPWEPGAYRPQY